MNFYSAVSVQWFSQSDLWLYVSSKRTNCGSFEQAFSPSNKICYRMRVALFGSNNQILGRIIFVSGPKKGQLDRLVAEDSEYLTSPSDRHCCSSQWRNIAAALPQRLHDTIRHHSPPAVASPGRYRPPADQAPCHSIRIVRPSLLGHVLEPLEGRQQIGPQL